MASNDRLTVGLAQIAPVFLNKSKTLEKVIDYIERAAAVRKCDLVVFGEVLVPGYPIWTERVPNASEFDNGLQKVLQARYLKEGVDIHGGDLDEVKACAKRHNIAVILGCAERGNGRLQFRVPGRAYYRTVSCLFQPSWLTAK